MKLAIHSDLHLEGNSLPKGFGSNAEEVDVVVLAGDIGVMNLEQNLADIQEAYKDSEIVFVPGNHEFYNFGFNDRTTQMAQICEKLGIHYLDGKNPFIYDGFEFIGSTGWSDTMCQTGYVDSLANLKIEPCISDFYKIMNDIENRKFSVSDMVGISRKQKWAIELDIMIAKERGNKPIVVTHFPPLLEVRNPIYKDNLLTRYFLNNWSDLIIKESPFMWIYGHIHYNSPVKEFCNTLLESNMRGYNKEDSNLSYNPSHILEL